MQSFPNLWKDEFSIIRDLGFDGIEWIYDKKSELYNPILTVNGRNEMQNISTQFHVSLENIVLDWFIYHPLLIEDQFRTEQKIEKLISLIESSAMVGFKRVILPILEQNSIAGNNNKKKFIQIFNEKISKILLLNNIEMHLETSLSPQEEVELVKELNNDKIRLCFDMGNSASLGYLPNDAINTVKDFLGSVHIKDRLLNGPSVPLGKGAVKFEEVFAALKNTKFDGPYSFQVYRNQYSDNAVLLKDNVMFIKKVMNDVYNE